MTIWIIEVDMNRYCGFRWVDPGKGQKWYNAIRTAKAVTAVWTPLPVEYDTTYYQEVDVPPVQGIRNFISLGTKIVLDRKALSVLLPLVSENIEALPVIFENEEFYLMNVVNVLDCLDHSRSEFTRFASGNIKKIEKYVFNEGCLDNQHIFRLAENNYSRTYVSDTFKSKVEGHQLIGLIFKKVLD